MNWDEIFEVYQSGTSGDTRAVSDRYLHVTEGLRKLYAHLDIPEVYEEFPIGVIPNQDFVDTDRGIYSLKWIQNIDGGHRLKPEPEGTLGRARYFASGTDMPPKATMESVNFYVREGQRIYLRDVPNETGTLMVKAKWHPDALTRDTDFSGEPKLPPQFHMKIARLGIASYYQIHPPMDPQTMVPMVNYGTQVENEVFAEVDGKQRDPKAEEALAHQKVIRQPGYQMGGCR